MTMRLAAMLLCLTALTYGCMPTVKRTAAACPPPPPPPPCAQNSVQPDSLFRAPWRLEAVPSLSRPDLQEFPAVKGARIGTAFGRVADAPGMTLITVMDTATAPGDANVAEVRGADTIVLPFSQRIAWDGHAIRVDDAIIYASERDSSMGGTDLWYVISNGGRYSAPRPLAGANTPCDELSPFYVAKERMLYWSTTGGPSMGGYDVVRARLTRSGSTLSVSDVVNVGPPINSAFDDIFPVITTTFYVASNRRDGTDFDVYRIVREGSRSTDDIADEEAPEVLAPTDSAMVSGTVIHQETQQPVADAQVTARAKTSRRVIGTTRTDSTGTWNLRVPVATPVEVDAQREDLFYDTQEITIPPSQANTIVAIQQPLSLPVTYFLRVNFPTAIFDAPYPTTLDSNGMETEQAWQQALDELAANVKLSGTRLKRLVLIGHTDDVGTDASNITLGKRRVEFVMERLRERGLNTGIMEGRSAGESLLPKRRNNESIDLWRKRSRRVELVKVLAQ